jgi:hypothetical protein
MNKETEYLTSRHYRCNGCGYEGKSYGFIKGDELLMNTFDPCERCDSLDFDILLSVPNIDRFGERFPYFDRGLGCMVTSKKQRLKKCKEMGVVPIDGDVDYSSDMTNLEQKHKEEDRIVEDIQEKMEHHPGFAEYRKAKDQGWKPEFTHREQNAPGVDPFNEEK